MDDDQLSNAKHALDSVYAPNEDTSSLLKLLDGLDQFSPVEGIFPTMLMAVPRIYLTRVGRRVDICGTVEEQSDEFKQGFRYFSDTGELFYKDGKCRISGDNPCDLVSLMDMTGEGYVEKSPIPHRWVHPHYWLHHTWFDLIPRNEMYLVEKKHYRNRMGMIITVKHAPSRSGDVLEMFHDDSNRRYASNGNLLGAAWSMFDLVAEVKSWHIFREHDWSVPGTPTKKSLLSNSPQLFDPTDDDRSEKLKQLFSAIADATIMAEELGLKLKMSLD